MSGPETIAFSRCTACGALDASAVTVCAKCLGSGLEPVQLRGEGTLVSWTTVRKPPLQFKADGAYHVGVFDLDQGPRITARFLPGEHDRIGDRVVAVPTPAAGPGPPRGPTFQVAKNG